MQRLRIRYAKRGRLRFTSHRDFARAFERALRRSGLPMAYSAGFSPHPKISYVGASPTGVASEAEYLEIGLATRVDPAEVAAALDAALPDGLDIVECVPAGRGTLPERIDGSEWRIELRGVEPEPLRNAVALLLAAETVPVERLTKNGRRTIDARAAIVSARVEEPAATLVLTPVTNPVEAATSSSEMAGFSASDGLPDLPYAILTVVVRQATPAVRPDDVLAALRAVAEFEPPGAPKATRLAQGLLDDAGRLADPLRPDRAAALPAREDAPGQAG